MLLSKGKFLLTFNLDEKGLKQKHVCICIIKVKLIGYGFGKETIYYITMNEVKNRKKR